MPALPDCSGEDRNLAIRFSTIIFIIVPLAEISRIEVITQTAKSSIRKKPVFVIVKKLDIIFRRKCGFALQRIHMVNQLPFQIVHRFIIHHRLFIQTFCFFAKYSSNKCLFSSVTMMPALRYMACKANAEMAAYGYESRHVLVEVVSFTGNS